METTSHNGVLVAWCSFGQCILTLEWKCGIVTTTRKPEWSASPAHKGSLNTTRSCGLSHTYITLTWTAVIDGNNRIAAENADVITDDIAAVLDADILSLAASAANHHLGLAVCPAMNPLSRIMRPEKGLQDQLNLKKK